MVLTKTPICDFGKKAEDFKLKSVNNKFFSLNDLKGEKGTLIMSNQTLFHRGSPFHSEKTRYMMVIYLRRSSDQDAEFTLGKPN